ncbi:MAG: hypothetical protein JRI85_00505 [Deltaproteobacteria bacterium]|nr:hypothetical protein [Deltaproteobacteria bacterium]
MKNVFLPINQSLFDGSAHAYYLFNHSWWLASENRGAQIVLIIPKARKRKDPFQWFGLKALPNLKIQELIAVKKKKGGFGLTLNRVYFWNVYRFLKTNLREEDIIFTASFIKNCLTMPIRKKSTWNCGLFQKPTCFSQPLINC